MPLPTVFFSRDRSPSFARAWRVITLSVIVIGLAPLVAAHAAETSEGAGSAHRHGEHAAGNRTASGPLDEPGQGAFAALAEIVAALGADPGTDWSRVDIDALREHLVSMDRLVLDAMVETETVDGGHRFTVSGEGRTLEAIREMVPAHAAALAAVTPWTVEATTTADGATLTVGSDDADERRRIGALGFFGLMATGDHHRPHHWAIATGRPMH